jgi:hypothetical protein
MPAIIVYPPQWHTTVGVVATHPVISTFSLLLSSAIVATSLLYAAERTIALLPGSLAAVSMSVYMLVIFAASVLIQTQADVLELLVTPVYVHNTHVPTVSEARSSFGQ